MATIIEPLEESIGRLKMLVLQSAALDYDATNGTHSGDADTDDYIRDQLMIAALELVHNVERRIFKGERNVKPVGWTRKKNRLGIDVNLRGF